MTNATRTNAVPSTGPTAIRKPHLYAAPDWSDPTSLARLMQLAEPIGRDGFARLVLLCDADASTALPALESAYAQQFGATGDLDVMLLPSSGIDGAVEFEAELVVAPLRAREARGAACVLLSDAREVKAWRSEIELSPAWFERCFALTEGMTSWAEAQLLFELARAARDGVIVEVGSYRGRSAVSLACGSRAGARLPVFAIEPHEAFVGVLGGRFGAPDRRAFYRAMLDTGAWDLVRLVNLSSEVVTATWSQPVALLWIDGDHRYDGVRRDFDSWAPHLATDAVVAFDDATDPKIGPWRLIEELVAARRLAPLSAVGKVRAFHLISSANMGPKSE